MIQSEAVVRSEERDYAAVQAPENEAAPEDKRELADRADSGKLAPALMNLASKAKNGNYTNGDVKVVAGQVEVFVYLDALTEAELKTIRALGGKTLNIARSSGMVHVRINVESLNALAALEFVKKITPPAL